ncbi:hypothetical protein BH737_11765 [Enterococcus hirae]|nr:hypothetical protein BH737_11765 [Enterococcus hirae]
MLREEEVVELKNNYAINIYLCIIDVAILSNDQKIDNNKFTSKMEKKLKHEQHKLLDVRYWLKIKVSIFLKLKIEMHSSSIIRKSNEATYRFSE